MNIAQFFRNPRTHDYSKRYWGHDYIFNPVDGGKRGQMSGWGEGIKAGDYLILQNGDATTRYQVTHIEYHNDPEDMWIADVKFAPR